MVNIFLMLFQAISLNANAKNLDPVLDYMQSCISYQDAVGNAATRDSRHRFCVGSTMFIYGSTKIVCEKSYVYAFSSINPLCADMKSDVQIEIHGGTQEERVDRLVRTKTIVLFLEQCVQNEESLYPSRTWQGNLEYCLGNLSSVTQNNTSDAMLFMDVRRFLYEFPVHGEIAFSWY